MKKCPKCASHRVQKWGKKNGLQEWKCQNCKYRFRNQRRALKKHQENLLDTYRRYAKHEQTLAYLSKERGVSARTLQYQFDQLTVVTGECIIKEKHVVVSMDVTSLGNLGGLLLCRSNKRNLYWKYTDSECIDDYRQAVKALETIGYRITGFVVDGKPGVIKMLQKYYPSIPCQYCQFHQMGTIKTYIPQRAQSEAARSLRRLTLQLSNYHSIQFKTGLDIWLVLHKIFLNEKTLCDDFKRKRTWRYTHQRLRSAYHSLRRNLPYLHTSERHTKIKMPNTTNGCDGYFAHLKERLKRHRGLSMKRKKKMTDYLLENWND